jgi:hypothetical protein
LIIAAITAVFTIGFRTAESTVVTLVIAIVIGGIVFLARRTKKASDKFTLLAMADKLEAISKELKPIESSAVIKLKANEAAYFESEPVSLFEYRSTGSSYSGYNQGISVPIVKGVRYSVGSSSGQITRNPEQQTQIDTGKAIFTNQRIIFIGPNITREWDLNKLLDMTSGPNGQTIAISVSNRQKTSGLGSIGRENLTPGMLASMAQQLNTGTVKDAQKIALEYATGIRALFIEESKN